MKMVCGLLVLVCLLLAWIGVEIRGLRPFTRSEYENMLKQGRPYEEFQKKIPITDIEGIPSVRIVQ